MNYTGDLSDSDRHFVEDVLTLHTALKTYKHNYPEDEDVANHAKVEFNGFDWKNEFDYLQYAHFLVSREPEFQKLSVGKEAGYIVDNHMRTLGRYRPMVEKWRELGEKQELTKDEALEILEVELSPAPRKSLSELN